jgi:hypothetical protein
MSSLLGKTVDLHQIKQEVTREFGLVFDLDIASPPLEVLIESTI